MRGEVKHGRWEPTLPPGYSIWLQTWSECIGSDGPDDTLPLRSLKSTLEELRFQAKLDHLAHPTARFSLYEDLLDTLRRRPEGFEFPAALSLCQELLKEKLNGAGCPKWRAIEASAQQATECIGLAEVRLRLNAIDEFCVNPSQDRYSRLQDNSASLVLDLLVAGYSGAYVATLPRIIGDGHMVSPTVLATQFPLHLYGLQAEPSTRHWLESLVWRERLDVIAKLFEAPEEALQVTLQLRGIKVKEPLVFGNVVVYDPFVTERLRPERPLGRAEKEKAPYPNIEITVRGRIFDHESVLVAARQAAGHHLDALAAYARTGSPLDLRMARYVISRGTEPVVTGTRTSAEEHDWLRYMRGPDLSDADEQTRLASALSRPVLRGLFNSSPLARVENRLGFAMAACRRGETSERPQQALLEYWSALEALIDAGSGPDEPASAIERIVKLVPAVQFLQHERFSVGWRLHSMLRHHHEQRPFPATIAAGAYLVQERGRQMILRQILSRLPDIRGALAALGEGHEFLLWQIQYAEGFYALSDVTLTHMKRFEINLVRDLQMAYRHRNRIVHDGCDVDILVREIARRLHMSVYSVLFFALSEVGESAHDYRSRLAAAEIRWRSLRKALQDKTPGGFALDAAIGAAPPEPGDESPKS